MEETKKEPRTKRFKKLKFVLKAIWANGNFKKVVGVFLILVGTIALLTPLTPGSWLALIGLGLLGYKAKWFLKLKSVIKRKKDNRKPDL